MSTSTASHDYVGDKPAPKTAPRAKPSIAYQVVQVLASLRLTVVLFSLSMVLVFFGTLGMMHDSIDETMRRVFPLVVRHDRTAVDHRFRQGVPRLRRQRLFARQGAVPGRQHDRLGDVHQPARRPRASLQAHLETQRHFHAARRRDRASGRRVHDRADVGRNADDDQGRRGRPARVQSRQSRSCRSSIHPIQITTMSSSSRPR